MKNIVVYIHGKGGNIEEASHYEKFFDCDVIGFDYHSEYPWDAVIEFREFFLDLKAKHESITVIANSIGAYYLLHSVDRSLIDKAYFISPIINMESIILRMMELQYISEELLKEKGQIDIGFGEVLSYQYLTWARSHQTIWNVPTSILYASNDAMQSQDVIEAFVKKTRARLTVMQRGEHWFHTKEQMAFLDKWLVGEINYKAPTLIAKLKEKTEIILEEIAVERWRRKRK